MEPYSERHGNDTGSTAPVSSNNANDGSNQHGKDGGDQTSPVFLTSSIRPREYQLSLFKRALSDNTVVILETGSGKTLVAVMLIQWFAQRESSRAKRNDSSSNSSKQPGKVRVFLNNTVALVHQQARVIAENTDQNVQEFIGSMGIDEWDEVKWADKWNSATVFVMTHQVLLNALRAGHIHISDIDLLVFDECHHARGHHPYALIMREFYDHCSADDRPHIFGMTASPLNARQTAELSVMHLQSALDSNICTVDLTAHTDDALVSKHTSICYEYKLPPEYEATRLTRALAENCGASRIVADGLRVVSVILPLLGPFGVDQMWHYKIIQWYRKMMHRPARSMRLSTNSYNVLSKLIDVDSEYLTSDITGEPAGHSSAAATVSEDPLRDALLLTRAIEIDREHGGRAFDQPTFDLANNMSTVLSKDKPQPIPHLHSPEADRKPWAAVRSKLSPQVNRLLDALYQWRNQPHELRGIVFAYRRLTAVLLVYIISRIAEFSFITADVLLGVSQKSSNGVDRPIREGSMRVANNMTLADFAKGRINLIFATQVAEEGVDIQPCNLVVRFDMPQTATSLIQSRGRARMAGSQFIVMVPEVNDSQKKMMSGDGMVVADAELQSGDRMLVENKEHTADSNTITSDESNHKRYPKELLPEHRTSYTDYLKLVSLEECLREWCRVESLAASEQPDDGIIVTDRSRKEHGMMLRRLRESLVLDDNPGTDLDEIWVEQKDKAGRIYTIVSTQARITYLSAVSIVHRYVQLLPQDALFKLAPVFAVESETHLEEQKVIETEPDECPDDCETTTDAASAETPQPAKKKKRKKTAPKPIKLVMYRCTTTLPANAAIRQVVGPLMPNKKLAKQASAYRTAKKLHQLGAIDDNLNPIIEVADDGVVTQGLAKNGRRDGGKGNNQGTRASVAKYECAIPCCFIPPLLQDVDSDVSMPAIDEKESIEDASIGAEHVYHPRPWHLYRFSLQHASSTKASWLVLATARPLPKDTLVPLYIAQFAKRLEELDSSATCIGLDYIGSQVLDRDQVDTLASFSSKLMARLIFAEMAWTTAEIGTVVAPALPDGSGIDLEFAKNCFKDRSGVYRYCNGDYTQYIGQVVMDGLDSGKLKIIEGVCDDVDIYSNLVQYHANRKGITTKANTQAEALLSQSPSSTLDSQLTLASVSRSESSSGLLAPPSALPIAETPSALCITLAKALDGDNAANPVKRKKGKKGASLRTSTQSMVEWALVKHIGRLVPKDDNMGRNVPLFKVKEFVLTNNYLVALPAHLTHGDQSTPNSPLASENRIDAENASQMFAYPDVIYTSPFFCAGEPLNIDELNNLSILPAFLLRLEHVLLAHAIKEELGLPAKTETIRNAITASSSSMDVCYERLETLGDSVLKYITSVALYITYPDDHEGLLTSRRSAIVGNHSLFNLSLERRLEEYIIANIFAKKDFRLPGKGWERFTSIHNKCICMRSFDIECNETANSAAKAPGLSESEQKNPKLKRQTRNISTSRQLSEKTIADIVESLLGACIIDGGFEGALIGARALGVVQNTWTSWSRFSSVWEATIATRKSSMRQLDILCSKAISSADKTEEIRDVFEELYLDKEDVLYGQSLLTDDIVLTEMMSKQYQGQSTCTTKTSWASDIERTLGYIFKDRSILIEALTHCSSVDLLSNSYQRLEYLGDAILDYFVTRRYYDYKPELSPHRITLVKHVAVSNNLFAVILVCHGLHRYIRHDSGILAESIKGYIRRLTHARNTWAKSQSESSDASRRRKLKQEIGPQNTMDGDGCGGDSDESDEELASIQPSSVKSMSPPWAGEPESRPVKCRKVDDSFTNGFCSEESAEESDDIFQNLPPECWNLVEPPKVLGDIFESLIGAVYVDSGMSNDIAKRFYDRLLSPFLDRFVDSGQLSLHPVVQSLLICQGWGCNLLKWACRSNSNQMEFINKYICDVKIHEHTVITAMGESARHAKFNASNAFLQYVGATAPNSLYGDMRTANLMPEQGSSDKGANSVSKLDKLLKPICTCFEIRRAAVEEAAAEAAAEVLYVGAGEASQDAEDEGLMNMDVDNGN
ncbi:Dicer-like protein 1 [Coemansia sp. RSA 1813]|nr:Dicer-like protein 1 [Coemansia sp. RSA 1646]KAJ1773721.1 Dicer-like protein 1 [Coemansia sp. RSA 1843]KAJ2093682.1 Dicer-like protein 1 [Coemansia sp. RSA 986]KAJ2217895.1 Dicer-like protein 1 [Coemansia sp. RSA 487]KAJ2573267.1 Dicer-like protein 1 [Coemansia sp. RSA 1813]